MRRFNLSLLAILALPHWAQADGEAAYAPRAPTTPIDYGVLIISRERLAVATPCDIGIYLQDQLAAHVFQGQSAAFNLQPGELSLRLATIGAGECEPGFEQSYRQSIDLRPGEVRRYRIALGRSGLYLLPAPAN